MEKKNTCIKIDLVQFLHESANYSDKDINIVCTYFNKTEHKILTTTLSISYVYFLKKFYISKMYPKLLMFGD